MARRELSVSRGRRRSRRVATVLSVFAASALAADQALQWTALHDGELAGRRIAPFDPPLFCPEQHASLERIRAQVEEGAAAPAGDYIFDADLGWAPRLELEHEAYRFDWAGARIGCAPLARAKVRGVARLVAIGCSFTYGAEVSGSETWAALYDEALPDVEVGNLALGAYGLDQALLRWRRDGRALGADDVWLGILPSAILRNVNVYGPAMRHWAPSITFKPRFVLDGPEETLRLVPNPVRSLPELIATLGSQERFLATTEADFFIRAMPLAYAPAGSHWTHRFAFTRLWLTHLERRARDSARWLADRDGEPYRVTRALVLATAREVAAEGARFRALVLPDRPGVREVALGGRGTWQGLVDDLRGAGIEVFDLAPALVAAGAADDDGAWARGGHYSARGNRIVAEALLATRR